MVVVVWLVLLSLGTALSLSAPPASPLCVLNGYIDAATQVWELLVT